MSGFKPILRFAPDHLPPSDFLLSCAALTLIIALGVLAIRSPQNYYEWFVYKWGHDELRRASPEKGLWYRRSCQFTGVVLVGGGLFFLALIVVGQIAK